MQLREDYFEKNNLIEVFEIVLKEPHGIDMLGYHRCRLPYDDVSTIMCACTHTHSHKTDIIHILYRS